ncbi:MAG: nitrous oxide-stimulated promoter family protein [Syntrophales bacterium]
MNRRIDRETETIRKMIGIYCRDHHPNNDLCPDCRQLLEYAEKRTNSCPFGKDKPVCADCPVHCYKPEMRKRIREVMRYAGPRMICRHPLLAIRHLLDKRLKKAPR